MGHFAHSGNLGGITLPLEIFRDPRLTGTDIKFLVALLEYRDETTGQVNPGGASIIAITGMSSSSLDRALKRLCKYGWVKYTSGTHKTTNEYRVTIPLEGDFKYLTRTKRVKDEVWQAAVQEREADIKLYVRRRNRVKNQWHSVTDEELLEELEYEEKEGVHYICDNVLKEREIVRGGDNSWDARERRHYENQ